MLAHLRELYFILAKSGFSKESSLVKRLLKKAQQDPDSDYSEFATDLIDIEERREPTSFPIGSNLISFDLYQHPLAGEIRAYCEQVAKVFPLDEKLRVGNTLPKENEVKNIIDLASRYDNNLNIYGDWKDNPNLLSPTVFKKLVSYIAHIVFDRSKIDIDDEEYSWAVENLVDIYTDFYTEKYLGSHYEPTKEEYTRKVDRWLDKNPTPHPGIVRLVNREGGSYPPTTAVENFSEVDQDFE